MWQTGKHLKHPEGADNQPKHMCLPDVSLKLQVGILCERGRRSSKISFGLQTDLNFILWSEFPSLGITDFFVLIILYPRGLSHALSNVLQPPWPLPIRVKEHSLLPQLGNPKYLQSLPNVPWKGEIASHLRTTEFCNHESVPGSRVI